MPLMTNGLNGQRRSFSLAAALPFLLSALLIGCSTPGGPPPPAADPSGEAAMPTEMKEDLITLSGPGQLLPVTATAEIKGETFQLEVAQDPQQQALGLMFRSELPDDRGMLFPFPAPRRTNFWMKNVPVPLDMVFLLNTEVVYIAAEAAPCASEPCPTYGPPEQIVDQVLELRGGRAAEIGLEVGDRVDITALSDP